MFCCFGRTPQENEQNTTRAKLKTKQKHCLGRAPFAAASRTFQIFRWLHRLARSFFYLVGPSGATPCHHARVRLAELVGRRLLTSTGRAPWPWPMEADEGKVLRLRIRRQSPSLLGISPSHSSSSFLRGGRHVRAFLLPLLIPARPSISLHRLCTDMLTISPFSRGAQRAKSARRNPPPITNTATPFPLPQPLLSHIALVRRMYDVPR